MLAVILESVLLCILFTLVIIASYKKNPLSGLHNLPIKIQERVQELPEYKDTKPEKILTTKERIIKKLPALFVLLILFTFIVYLGGARNFKDGFIYSFMIWSIIKLYVVCILDCLWYAHSPKYWIPGTEDLKSEYQNYQFYFSSIPRSLLAGCIVSLIIGIILQIIC